MKSYFTLEELCATNTKLTNIPSFQVVTNLKLLVDNLLDPIRIIVGVPVKVTSGFRSIAVNKAVGGAKNSQHLKGEAADITIGSKEDNKSLFELIIKSDLIFDQCILENYGEWIHISYRNNKNRKQILNICSKEV